MGLWQYFHHRRCQLFIRMEQWHGWNSIDHLGASTYSVIGLTHPAVRPELLTIDVFQNPKIILQDSWTLFILKEWSWNSKFFQNQGKISPDTGPQWYSHCNLLLFGATRNPITWESTDTLGCHIWNVLSNKCCATDNHRFSSKIWFKPAMGNEDGFYWN